MSNEYSKKLRLIKQGGLGLCFITLAVLAFWRPNDAGVEADPNLASATEQAPKEAPDLRQALLNSIDPKKRLYNIQADAVSDLMEGENSQSQDPNKRNIRLTSPNGTLLLKDKSTITLAANGGSIVDDILELNGQVSFIHDGSGYAFKTEEATINLTDRTAEGDKAIQGHNASSRITADGFRIKQGGRNIFFSGNAVLFLYPDASKNPN